MTSNMCQKIARALSYICVLSLAITLVGSAKAAAFNGESGIATGTSLLWTSNDELNERLADIKNLGAEWVRVDFNWSEIQKNGSDHYQWLEYDRVVDTAKKYDIKLLATLVYSPEWARDKSCTASLGTSEQRGRVCMPYDANKFGRFVRAAVIRYNLRGVYAWEVWNEPNLTGYLQTFRGNRSVVDPGVYAAMANAAAREIKLNDPGSFVITGGLAPLFEPSPSRGMRQSDFLRRLLPLLDEDYFDAVGIHPYSWPKLPGKIANYNAFFTVDGGRPEHNLYQIMSDNGWGDKQLWATEFGASTRGLRPESEYRNIGPRPDHVSEYKQALIIAEGLKLWKSKPNAGPIFVYSDSDIWLSRHGTGNETGFGLRRKDGSPKPAYDAFRDRSR